MARAALRKPVRFSEAATSSSITIAVSSASEPHEAENLTQHLARLMSGQDDVGDGDRAGIDEGVAWNAVLVFELDDRIERAAGWLAADPPPQPVADHAQRESQREDFRDALDRERRVAVTGGRDLAVHADDRDSEMFRIDAASSGI